MAAWSNADAVDEEDGACHAAKMERPLSQFQDLRFSLVCARVEDVFDFRGGQDAIINTNLINQPIKVSRADTIWKSGSSILRTDSKKPAARLRGNISGIRGGITPSFSINIQYHIGAVIRSGDVMPFAS